MTQQAEDPGWPRGVDLAGVVGDARVVLLGEATHGDGTGMLEMTKLVKRLHAEGGFRVLALESPMWDVARGFERLAEGEDPSEAIPQAVFSMWSKAVEMEPLWAYVASQAQGPRPLRLVGLDWQLLPHGTAELLAELGDVPTSIGDLREVAAGAGTNAARAALDRWKSAARHRPALARVVDGLQGWHDSLARLAIDPLDVEAYCARDIWMGRRCLEIVAEEPEAKVIVWAASFHAARGSPVIEGSTSEGHAYSSLVRMGDVVAEGLETKAKVIALTAAGGRFGLAGWPNARTIPAPLVGSLEQRCLEAGLGVALVEAPSSPAVARPFGYQPMKASWAEVVDAFLFVPDMERAHPTKT